MPILCSRASVSLRLRSKSESSGVISLFCWLSDCSGNIEKCQFIHHVSQNKLKHARACTFWSRIPRPTFCTHRDVCMHARTHTTSAFFVSRPDKKQSNTQTTHTRVPYGMSVSCMKLLTFFLTSFFFLSSSFLFFSSLIWARRCFLRSSSAFRSLLSDMASYRASRKEEDRTGVSYVWQCHCAHCYMISYGGAQVYPVSFSDASQSLLGVAVTRTWYWQNGCRYRATLSREGLSHWCDIWIPIPAELFQCMWAIFR